MGWPAHCICLQMLPPAARAVITPIGILFQPNRAPPSTFGRQCHHQCTVGSRRTAPAQLADGASGGLGCGSLAQLTLPGLAPRSLLVQLRQRWLETTDSTRRGNAFLNPVRHGYQHPPGLCPPEPQAGQAAVIGSGTSAAAPSRYSARPPERPERTILNLCSVKTKKTQQKKRPDASHEGLRKAWHSGGPKNLNGECPAAISRTLPLLLMMIFIPSLKTP
jgi:hypothetical protein